MSKKRFILILILFSVIMFVFAGCGSDAAVTATVINTAVETNTGNTSLSPAPGSETTTAPSPQPSGPVMEVVGGYAGNDYVPGYFKNSVQELEESSAAILIVTVLSKQNPDYEALAKMPIGTIKVEEIRMKLTTVRIDEVFRSDCGLKTGEEVIIGEHYRTYPHPRKENTIIAETSDGTIPMNIGSRYLLFLKKADKNYKVVYGDDYYLCGGWQGKYPVTEKTIHANTLGNLSFADMEFSPGNVNDQLLNLAQQVYQKYFWSK